MDTTLLKSFATSSRTELIREVAARITAVLAQGSAERVEQPSAVSALERAISVGGGDDKGKEHVADKVAYTWFNRIIALRFMDANGYTGIGVVSPAPDQVGQPEILAAAKRGQVDGDVVKGTNAATVTGLLNGTRQPRPGVDAQAEAYSLLLADYCRYWNRAMPFMFEREGDFTELLIPANMLAEDSVLSRSLNVLTEEVCRDVEVIGWLYQFYISERKDEVFAGFKKNRKAGADEIPAATQLFTPHWIVRYLVENSVGRLWMLNHPESRLVDLMDYYIAPVDEETDFLKITSPEGLTVIDPACGSGHMLTYAFDLLYAIYEEEGYTPSQIPGLILTNNLYGTEIDPRAGALAAFALTMKAAARRKLFLKDPVEPSIGVLKPISFSSDELSYLVTDDGDRHAEEAFWNQFTEADTFGSLIQPDPTLTVRLTDQLLTLDDEGDIFRADGLNRARQVIRQAEFLLPRYSVVVANPPYMGTASMGAKLVEFAKRYYPRSKNDLFAMFIERNLNLAALHGEVGMITMQSWMFLAAFQALRETILRGHAIDTIAHLGAGAFESIGGEVVTTVAFTMRSHANAHTTSICRLVDIAPASAKDAGFRALLRQQDDARWFRTDLRTLLRVPRSPFAYWFSKEIVSLFDGGRSVSTCAETAKGMVTADNASYVRQWWEVSFGNIGFGSPSRSAAEELGTRWFPYARGGSYRKWFGNIDAVVDWHRDGRAIQTTMTPDGQRVRATNTNLTRIFKRGITWSSITTGRPSFRLVDQGHLYDAAGGICQSSFDLYLMGLLNSRAIETVLHGLNPTINLPPDYVGAVPIPDSGPNHAIDDDVSRAVEIQRTEWKSRETAWEFVGHAGMDRARKVQEFFEEHQARLSAGEDELAALERRLDSYFDAAFGVRSDPLREVTDGRAENRHTAFDRSLDLISYAVGCMSGRYSLNAPGLILADQGATLQDYLVKVPNPVFTPDSDNVIPLVDGDWFEDDIVERFRQFLRAAFGEQHFEENLQFVTKSLGVKHLRDYFVKSFYKDHIKRYKKRPIYWLFSSPKGSFNALIYMHRYTPSTVSTVLTYLREYVTKLESALQQAERAGNAKEADRLRKILVELNEYEHDTLFPKASENIVIDLDDGVKVNYPKFGAALKKIPGLEASSD